MGVSFPDTKKRGRKKPGVAARGRKGGGGGGGDRSEPESVLRARSFRFIEAPALLGIYINFSATLYTIINTARAFVTSNEYPVYNSFAGATKRKRERKGLA